MARKNLIDRLADLVGRELVDVIDQHDRWPGFVRIRLEDGELLLAVHIGSVGLTYRDRDDVERRIQNPGQNRPLSAPGNSFPLLLGLWEQGPNPVLVGMDAVARIGRLTRQSLFMPLWLLHQAAITGWAQHHSTSGELIIGFHPALLPTYVELRQTGLVLPQERVRDVIAASGLASPPEEWPEERARRSSLALVRRARFSQNVVDAYDGLCAMCGLDSGLVEGAHIYPVRAPFSPDATWNGIALCGNHHSAFDRHLIWIEPSSRSIKIHPKVLSDASQNTTCRYFVEMTYSALIPPRSVLNSPKPEMFQKRYDFFHAEYAWSS